jgi:glutathione S-transferase
MVKLVLHGDEKSTCTQKILILLEELELKYDFVNIDLSSGKNKEKEYLYKQPFGKVPYIEYGEMGMFESRFILRYISKANRDIKDLYGEDNVYADMWLEVEGQNFNPPISKIVWEKVYKKMFTEKEEDEKVVNESLIELEKVFSVYNNQLQDKEYLTGSYSIADISHIPYMYKFIKCDSFKKESAKEILKRYPNVYNWIRRLLKRDAVREVLKKNN